MSSNSVLAEVRNLRTYFHLAEGVVRAAAYDGDLGSDRPEEGRSAGGVSPVVRRHQYVGFQVIT